VAEHRQRRGQHRERRDHRDEDRAHPAERHRVQEHLGEDEHARQGQGDGQAGDDNRSSGGADGVPRGLLGRVAKAELLAVAVDHDERVVDGHAQPEQGDRVDRERRHRGDRLDRARRGQRAQYRYDPDEQRHQRRDHAAEDDGEQHEHHGEGEHLAARHVALGHVIARGLNRDVPAGLRRQSRCGQVLLDCVEGGAALAVVGGLELDGEVGGVAAGGHEPLVRAVVVAGDGGDRRRGAQPGLDSPHRVAERLRVHRRRPAAVADEHVRCVPAEFGRDPLRGERRLAARVVEPARGEPAERRGPPRDADDDEGARRDQHGQPPADHLPGDPLEHEILHNLYSTARVMVRLHNSYS
jgi:hypothetical protein